MTFFSIDNYMWGVLDFLWCCESETIVDSFKLISEKIPAHLNYTDEYSVTYYGSGVPSIV